MTRQRNDTHSTEFGLWLRQQHELESGLGFVATNLDYVWANYKTGDWMLIEEKRYAARCTLCQKELFQWVHRACVRDPHYHGLHLLCFEVTSPDDGAIFWNNVPISRATLLELLSFKRRWRE